MKSTLFLSSLLLALVAMASETNTPPDKPEPKPQTAEVKAPTPPPPPPMAALSNAPIALESVKAAQEKAARMPVYVIPEVLVVTMPNQTIVFAEQHHVLELAKKFSARRVTNVIVYADGL